jgi:hypothetical protein
MEFPKPALPSTLGTPRRALPSPLAKGVTTPRYTPKPSSLQDLDRKFPPIDDAEESHGKAGIVYFATSNPGNRRVAIKRQCLPNPKDSQSIAYRELKIMQTLANKITRAHNFISLLDWNKVLLANSPPKAKKSSKIQSQSLYSDHFLQ